jgi:hypothetical protein
MRASTGHLRQLAESHFSCVDRQKVSLPEHERVQYPLSCFRCAGNECGVTHCQTLWPLDKLHIGKWMFKLTGFTRGFVRRVAAAGAQERIREDIQYTDGA